MCRFFLLLEQQIAGLVSGPSASTKPTHSNVQESSANIPPFTAKRSVLWESALCLTTPFGISNSLAAISRSALPTKTAGRVKTNSNKRMAKISKNALTPGRTSRSLLCPSGRGLVTNPRSRRCFSSFDPSSRTADMRTQLPPRSKTRCRRRPRRHRFPRSIVRCSRRRTPRPPGPLRAGRSVRSAEASQPRPGKGPRRQ